MKQSESTGRNANSWSVITQLPDGPLDLVGDIHGELEVLKSLMEHLGYSPSGSHPQGRTLVFLGDLIDRGPDSPGVVRLVSDLMERGRAVAVMGNHDLNAAAELLKADNTWLMGHGPVQPSERIISGDHERTELIRFCKSLPIAGVRHDLRVIHACWDDAALATLQGAPDPVTALREHRAKVKATLAPDADEVTRNLALQNQNPMKLLTSGPEKAAVEPFFAAGKMRTEARDGWWDRFDSGSLVVFGHYWRIPIETLQKDDRLFSRNPLCATLGKGKAMCVDYSVGGRASERRAGVTEGSFKGRLAAMRWPECELVFDNGERQKVTGPDGKGAPV